MNKTELSIVVILFAVLLSWGFFQHRFMPQPAPEPGNREEPAVPAAASESTTAPVPAPAVRESGADMAPAGPAEILAGTAPEGEGVSHAESERTVVLSNELTAITVSSWGGTITGVQLSKYPETQEEDSGPVHLDFSSRAALAISGIPGLSTSGDFELRMGTDSRSVTVARSIQGGLRFERIIRLEEDEYRLAITDTMTNEGDEAVALPEHGVSVGPMSMISSKAKTRGVSYLGIDTLPSHGGKKVEHWGRKRLPGFFGRRSSMLSCAQANTGTMPPSISRRIEQPLTWMAVKNKFFVQILAPEGESVDGEVCAERDMESSGFTMSTVWGSMFFPGKALASGESFSRSMSYFVGPKKQARLKKLGEHQDEVMEFGWFSWMCKPLLVILNKIHAVVKNYGVAIILLTALVRIVFWPVTHKSTESMKKMQKLQPLITEIREKYKSNPQKMNQEVMALYKERKVNPMAGCLPMVIQIPVFIALFTVLRSAVELRFAGFLWIRDLSEPENLFAGMIPIVGALNILPLFMTATMVWQQRLTPTAGDPQQQKMMMIMPIVMLFIFYSMPSALVLYWSTSQGLAIVQLLIQRRKKEDGKEEDVVVLPPSGKGSRKGKGR